MPSIRSQTDWYTSSSYRDFDDFDSFEELRRKLHRDVARMEADIARWRSESPIGWDSVTSSSSYRRRRTTSRTRSSSISSRKVHLVDNDSSDSTSADSDLGLSETMSPTPRKGILKTRSASASPNSWDTKRDKLFYRFDVGNFRSPDLTVQIVNDKLRVVASRTENEVRKSSCDEYSREVQLPKDFDPQSAISSLSPDGILEVEIALRDSSSVI